MGDSTALIQPETPAALAVLPHIQRGISPLSPEPRGRSMQDTGSILVELSRGEVWDESGILMLGGAARESGRYAHGHGVPRVKKCPVI
jgi:hypothetical protein